MYLVLVPLRVKKVGHLSCRFLTDLMDLTQVSSPRIIFVERISCLTLAQLRALTIKGFSAKKYHVVGPFTSAHVSALMLASFTSFGKLFRPPEGISVSFAVCGRTSNNHNAWLLKSKIS